MFLEKSLNAASYFYSDHGSEKLGFTDHWCLFHRFQRSVKGAIVFFFYFSKNFPKFSGNSISRFDMKKVKNKNKNKKLDRWN